MILRKLRYKILVLVLDLSVATAILLATWIIEYKRPQAGIRVQAAQTKEVQYSDGGPRNEIGNADLTKTKRKTDNLDWHKKFASHFTDEVVVGNNTYSSPDIAIELTYHQYDSGVKDTSAKGKHLKYGSNISYVLADIYIGDISCLQTALQKTCMGLAILKNLRTCRSV